MREVVYATTNPGKFSEVSKLFLGYGIKIKSAIDFNVNMDVEETGKTLEENAVIKAEAYLKAINQDVIVVSDDTGLEIDALNGEPGIKVRRWKGYKMSDEEIISYAIERLTGIPENRRTAHFRTVISVASKGTQTRTFSGQLDGRILAKPLESRVEGLPFQPLFFSTEYNLMLGQLHDMSIEEKIERRISTHRERAVIAALPYLATLNH
jgi:XTP/dITP diphosphohydrolase